MRAEQSGDLEFKGKGQALRLRIQQELGGGPPSIFGEAAQKHDLAIREVTAGVLTKLAEEFPNLEFRQRNSLTKKEINEKLRSFDPRLGQALFVESAYPANTVFRSSTTSLTRLFLTAKMRTRSP